MLESAPPSNLGATLIHSVPVGLVLKQFSALLTLQKLRKSNKRIGNRALKAVNLASAQNLLSSIGRLPI